MTLRAQPSTSLKILRNKYWLDVPARAVIYPTNKCNFACNHCYASDFSYDELSLKQYSDIFKKIFDWGVLETVFLGGEPMLRKDFLDIAEFAGKIGLGTKMSTNGSFINTENVNRVHDLFSGKMQVSLDSAVEEINDAIRGEGSFAKTLKGIDILLERETEFSIGSVVTNLNYKQLPEIYEFAQSRGIKGIHIVRVMPKGRALDRWDQLVLTNEQWISAITSLRKVANEEFPKLQIDGIYEYSNSTASLGKCMSGCEAGRYEITILSDGNVVPCDMFNEQIIGKIMKLDLDKEWLNNSLYEKFRQSKGKLEGKCGKCDIDFCVGCRYQAFALRGSFYAEDPFCVYEELKNV